MEKNPVSNALESILKGLTDPIIINAYTDHICERVIQKLLSDINLQPKTDLKNEKEADLISPSEALKLTSPPISRTNLYYWTKAGKLQAFKVGKRVFYSKKAVLSFLTSVIKKPPKR